MVQAEISLARRSLLAWYRNARRPLPWRNDRDPYRVWISEIMLQQTTVKSAIPHYERFLQCFPTLSELAGAPLERVLGSWSGLGYYSRARNLHAAAIRIVREYSGAFPCDIERAIALPGVGPYTAAAVLSISYGAKIPVLDGNASRVLARLHAVRGSLRLSKVRKRLEALAGEFLDPASPGDFNQAIMELGALVCTPRSPDCPACPLSVDCSAHRMGLAGELPEPEKSAPVRHETMAVAVIEKNGAVLLQRRPDRAGPLEGLWELPNVTLSRSRVSTERMRQELERSLRLNVHRTALVTDYAGAAQHAIMTRRINILVFRAWLSRTFRPGSARRWIPMDQIADVGTSSIVRKSLELCNELARSVSTV